MPNTNQGICNLQKDLYTFLTIATIQSQRSIKQVVKRKLCPFNDRPGLQLCFQQNDLALSIDNGARIEDHIQGPQVLRDLVSS